MISIFRRQKAFSFTNLKKYEKPTMWVPHVVPKRKTQIQFPPKRSNNNEKSQSKKIPTLNYCFYICYQAKQNGCVHSVLIFPNLSCAASHMTLGSVGGLLLSDRNTNGTKGIARNITYIYKMFFFVIWSAHRILFISSVGY